ncbi:hypothetical protein K7G98_30970, partial [Saccharothrix sp. MB29]|nr:hypothetical protein [Saccharothrix sp. MB29]
ADSARSSAVSARAASARQIAELESEALAKAEKAIADANARAEKTVIEADARAEKTITEADAHADRRVAAADRKLAELHSVHRAVTEQFGAAQEAITRAMAGLTPLDAEALADDEAEKAAAAGSGPAGTKAAEPKATEPKATEPKATESKTDEPEVDPSEQPTTQLPVPKAAPRKGR